MYLLIDNYDSFTYNIYQYLIELTREAVTVVRCDAVSIDEIKEMDLSGIIISPGPGRPEDAGISVDVIKEFSGKVPILGICLGHQAIGYAFGGSIVQAKHIVHGKAHMISHDGRGVYRGIPSPSVFTRYHSLVISRDTLSDEFEITASSDDGEIMGIRHKTYPLEGVQFHPESMASEYGKRLLKNFLIYKREAFPFTGTLEGIIKGENLTRSYAADFMEEMTEGNLTSAQIAGYLTALNAKEITPEEIAGFTEVLQRKRVEVRVDKPLLDTCGTGGDGMGTFNISSMTAVAAAACGAVVAKHGNRAVSSVSGSADFYRALHIPIDIAPKATERLIEETGFGFLFAPLFHGAMRHAAAARRELGIKTVMNLLGPLANPAGAEYQLIGVFDEKYCRPVAKAAKLLGRKRVMTVHSADGLDEISVNAPTKLVFIDENGELTETIFRPEEAGVSGFTLKDLQGGSAEENGRIAETIMENRGYEGIKYGVSLNTGAALYVYGLTESVTEGFKLALNAFESGTVLQKYREIVETGKKLAEAQ